MTVSMVRKAPTTSARGTRAPARYPTLALSSRPKPSLSSLWGRGRGMRESRATESRYVPASSTKAVSTPTAATSSPPSTGPSVSETRTWCLSWRWAA